MKAIKAHKTLAAGKLKYLVQWAPPQDGGEWEKEETWEPASRVQFCATLIKEYWEKQLSVHEEDDARKASMIPSTICLFLIPVAVAQATIMAERDLWRATEAYLERLQRLAIDFEHQRLTWSKADYDKYALSC